MWLITDMMKTLRPDEKLDTFGKGCIHLNENNIVYLELAGDNQKALSFGTFKRNVHYYSEQMVTPCVAVFPALEGRAMINARKGKRARENYMR